MLDSKKILCHPFLPTFDTVASLQAWKRTPNRSSDRGTSAKGYDAKRRSSNATQRLGVGQEAKIKGQKDCLLVEGKRPGSEDRNPARTLESNDKVTEETALLAEMEKCQLEANPSGASPDLTCKSHILSNIMHKPVEASNQRDSWGLPQVSTEESPQGIDQSYSWQTPMPMGQVKGDPLVFDINTNSIKKLTKRLVSNLKRPQDESPVTFPSNSRSFKEILESVINDLPKVTLLEREDKPPHCILEEETSTKNIDETLDTFDSSEIQYKIDEPVSVRKNPLFGQEKQDVVRDLIAMHKPSHPQANTLGGNSNCGTTNTPNYNTCSNELPQHNQGTGNIGSQTCPIGQGFNNHHNMNVGSNWTNNNTWGSNNLNLIQNATMFPNGDNQSNFYGNSCPNHSS
eukprot:Gb_24912 [translate_table: standard]